MFNEKDYRKKYDLNRYRKKRLFALNFLGNKCSTCNSTERMEIDHVDRSKKKYDLSKTWGLPEMTFLEELLKCQILCYKCHKKKHESKHGTISRYRHRRCRCSLCKKAWSNALKNWKQGPII